MIHDAIHLRGIELPVRLGVPDDERAAWQLVTADVSIRLSQPFELMADELSETVDYEGLTKSIKALAASRPRKLLEVLASEIMVLLMDDPRVWGAALELRKRILPGVEHAAVSMERTRG